MFISPVAEYHDYQVYGVYVAKSVHPAPPPNRNNYLHFQLYGVTVTKSLHHCPLPPPPIQSK